MATKIMDNFYKIEVPLPRNPLQSLNSYLFMDKERNLLIDTGFNKEECRSAILEQLLELGCDMAKTDIFLTHLHSDHSGLGTELVAEGRTIYMGKTDAICLNHHLDDDYWLQMDDLFVKSGFPKEDIGRVASVNPAKISMPEKHYPYTYVYDGQTMAIGGYTLKFIETPGHTPGHMCIYLEKEQILIGGDHILFEITPNISAWLELPNALKSYLGSLEKIRRLKVKKTYVSHRSTDGNLYQRISQLMTHHDARLNEAYEVVKKHPGQNGNFIASKMTWDITAKSWADFPLAQKWFAIGETAAHLIFLEEEGKIQKELVGDYYQYTVKNQG